MKLSTQKLEGLANKLLKLGDRPCPHSRPSQVLPAPLGATWRGQRKEPPLRGGERPKGGACPPSPALHLWASLGHRAKLACGEAHRAQTDPHTQRAGVAGYCSISTPKNTQAKPGRVIPGSASAWPSERAGLRREAEGSSLSAPWALAHARLVTEHGGAAAPSGWGGHGRAGGLPPSVPPAQALVPGLEEGGGVLC